MMLVPQLTDTIAEVNFNATLVNQDIIHALVSHDALILRLELNKCELQRVSSLPVTDDLARDNLAKARENYLKVL